MHIANYYGLFDFLEVTILHSSQATRILQLFRKLAKFTRNRPITITLQCPRVVLQRNFGYFFFLVIFVNVRKIRIP